jgi:N-methylhydantoinase A/oxoprolinase/acetone carboxylase beta subunit
MTVEHGNLLGVPLQTPWTLLRSEAVGGGSVARGDTLGPDSQGAYPGPACYDLGGRLPTLTDAFLVAGMLNPARFLGGRRALRVDLAREALGDLDAERVIDRAAEMVAEAARATLAQSGDEPFELYCFGGNGGNFAARLAEKLGRPRAYVFALGPVLSAFGSSVAEICHVYEEWGEDTDAIVARGSEQVMRDLAGEDDVRIEVEIADRVIVRGYAPVPIFEPRRRDEEPHQVTGDVLVWEELRPGATADGPARLESDTNTCTIPAGWSVRIDGHDNAILERR